MIKSIVFDSEPPRETSSVLPPYPLDQYIAFMQDLTYK